MDAAGDLGLLARVTASLVIVVVLALLAARLARRSGVSGGGVGLRVVDRAGLTRDAAVAVIEVAGRGLVVGVTSHGVSVLTELDPQALADVRAEPAPRPDAPRQATGATRRPTGAVLDPRTWAQGLEALRERTTRRG